MPRMKCNHYLAVAVALYVGNYAWLYSGSVSAANLAYFVYLGGGVRSEGIERALYC